MASLMESTEDEKLEVSDVESVTVCDSELCFYDANEGEVDTWAIQDFEHEVEWTILLRDISSALSKAVSNIGGRNVFTPKRCADCGDDFIPNRLWDGDYYGEGLSCHFHTGKFPPSGCPCTGLFP